MIKTKKSNPRSEVRSDIEAKIREGLKDEVPLSPYERAALAGIKIAAGVELGLETEEGERSPKRPLGRAV